MARACAMSRRSPPPTRKTLVLTTDTAYECLPLLLDIPVIKDGSRDEAVPLGSGPYVMDGDTRLVRNTNWWQTAAPIVDFAEVKLTLVEKTSEVRDNFEYENVNLVLTDPNSAAFAGFHNDYELWDARLPIMQYIGYNITSKVFSNYGLRSAITYAIDRDHLATDIMGGFAQPAVLPASPQAPFYDGKLANTYGYNLTKFSQQLESASVEDMDNDGTLDLYVPSLGYAVSVAGTMIVCSSSYQRVEAATEVVNALNALGFKITLKTLELSEFRQALQTGNFDLYYGEIRLSNNFDLTPFFSASGSMCYGGLDDSVMLNLCTQALANNGNSYNLYKRLCERGYITPVLFKKSCRLHHARLDCPPDRLHRLVPDSTRGRNCGGLEEGGIFMTVAEAMQKMILLSRRQFHDINHFLKVHAYALTIGACEGLSQAQRYTLELAAIVHDIACPLCREKYGNTNGKYQEQEGAPLTRAFFEGTDVPSDTVERVVWLVAHHHTLRPIDGIDHQILVEADYLVNAEESGLAEANIRHMGETIFKTGTGKQLLQSLYLSH